MNLADAKVWIEQHVGLEQDALHVHVALLLYLSAMFAFRRGWRSPLPFLVVLGIELLNEAYDLLKQFSQNEPLRYHESVKDAWNTMVWPTALLLIGRYTNLLADRGADTATRTVSPHDGRECEPVSAQGGIDPPPPSS
jgi:hypothetical protein